MSMLAPSPPRYVRGTPTRPYRPPPRLPHPRRLSWFDALGEWADFEIGNGTLAPHTAEQYATALIRAAWRLRKEPADWTEADLSNLLREMAPKGSTREQLKSAAKSYFRWAVPRGIHDHDPAAALRFKAPKYLPAESLTREEFEAAAEHLRAHRDPRRWPAIGLLLETGARIGSMAWVRPEHTGTEPDELIRFEVAKFSKPYAVPLSEAGARFVRMLLPGCNGLLIGCAKQTLAGWWKAAATRAELPESKRRTHILRDTFATNHLTSGTDVRVVQELLNHEDLTTMTRYTAVTHRRMRSAVAVGSVMERFPD